MSVVQFLSVFLLGLVTGISFSHLLQRGPKKTLPPAQFLAVQQVLIRNYGPVVGGLELTAFVAALAWAIVRWDQPVVRMLALIASACLAAMVAVWAVWINPINRTVNSWTPESIPSEWPDFRERWHMLHTIRLALSAIAFSAAIAASLA